MVLGTDTDVGKTYVACRIVESLVSTNIRVGTYKPVASGVTDVEQSDGARLWNASGCRGAMEQVTPQSFLAPLAPPIAAQLEQRTVDEQQVLQGLATWREHCDFLVVEGAGGLLSPISWSMTNADLAVAAKLPIVLVSTNRLGVVNQVLTALVAATSLGLEVRCVVLNHVESGSCNELSLESNEPLLKSFLMKLPHPPIITTLGYGQQDFCPNIQWDTLCVSTS